MKKRHIKIRRMKYPFEGRAFRDGILALRTSYMWVEKAMRDADVEFGSAYYYKYGTCCVCGWNGVHTHEIILSGTHVYIPLCSKCENFMWGTHGTRPRARIYYNPVETNRRKF